MVHSEAHFDYQLRKKIGSNLKVVLIKALEFPSTKMEVAMGTDIFNYGMLSQPGLSYTYAEPRLVW